MRTIVLTSGYFNPIHPWHIECLNLCKGLGDELRVIVNNDHQARIKTNSQELFQDQDFRLKIVSAVRAVDGVFLALDQDTSVCKSIKYLAQQARQKFWPQTQIIFWKWGDRFTDNIPEVQICKDLNIQIKDGLWLKIDNSSTYRAKKL